MALHCRPPLPVGNLLNRKKISKPNITSHMRAHRRGGVWPTTGGTLSSLCSGLHARAEVRWLRFGGETPPCCTMPGRLWDFCGLSKGRRGDPGEEGRWRARPGYEDETRSVHTHTWKVKRKLSRKIASHPCPTEKKGAQGFPSDPELLFPGNKGDGKTVAGELGNIPSSSPIPLWCTSNSPLSLGWFAGREKSWITFPGSEKSKSVQLYGHYTHTHTRTRTFRRAAHQHNTTSSFFIIALAPLGRWFSYERENLSPSPQVLSGPPLFPVVLDALDVQSSKKSREKTNNKRTMCTIIPAAQVTHRAQKGGENALRLWSTLKLLLYICVCVYVLEVSRMIRADFSLAQVLPTCKSESQQGERAQSERNRSWSNDWCWRAKSGLSEVERESARVRQGPAEGLKRGRTWRAANNAVHNWTNPSLMLACQFCFAER